MTFANSIKKPEYYFRPNSIFKRLFEKQKGVLTKTTPWKSSIEIDIHETIGKAIYRTGIYDLAVSEILWRLIEPGNFVLDIGANIGFTSSLCSHRAGFAGNVWSFEPNPLLIQRLTKNIQYNKYQNVTLFPVALSDSNKEGYLVLPEMYNVNEGVAFIGAEENDKTIKIQLKKLDDLLPDNAFIDVLKIDVEGHELAVFNGAQNTINKRRISNIIFEDHNEYPSAVSVFLVDHGYDIFRIEKGWFNIVLKNPESVSAVSSWEPANYIATLDKNFVKKKMKGLFYRCLF